MTDYTTAEKLRRINDCFRRNMAFGGDVLLTSGVASLEAERLAELLELVRKFDKFTPDNDPHGEHDFGAIELSAVRYFWKIDYYDLYISRRVLTIMRADEY